MTLEHTLTRGGRLGRVELVAIARRFALEEGTSLEQMVWRVVQALYQRAVAGHTDSAAMFLDLTSKEALEVKQKAALATTVNIAAVGPAMPAADYVAEVRRVLDGDLRAEEAKLLGHDRSDDATGS